MEGEPVTVVCICCQWAFAVPHSTYESYPRVCPYCKPEYMKASSRRKTRECRARQKDGTWSEPVTFVCLDCQWAFAVARKKIGAYYPVRCPECRYEHLKAKQRRYRRENPEATRASEKRRKLSPMERSNRLHRQNPDGRRRRGLKYLYGITLEQYAAMFEEQGGLCRICGQQMELFSRSCHLDHDHRTGAVRALLCHHCNHGLGSFRDNAETLRRAADYILSFEGEGGPAGEAPGLHEQSVGRN